MKKLSILLSLTLAVYGLRAQVSISPQVLNSAGSDRALGTTSITITDNVGEPFTQSAGYGSTNFLITEGFVQPDKVAGVFTLTPLSNPISCLDKLEDAFATAVITAPVSKYDVKFYWSDPSYCPNNDCAKIDSLKPGVYTVTAALQYTNTVGIVHSVTVTQSYTITMDDTPCSVKVFSGISANHDGVNDFFTIENVHEYPNNHVSIFNRWGNLMYDTDGYDQNISGKRWPDDEHLTKLTSGTYFYIVTGVQGSKPRKGWVELIKD